MFLSLLHREGLSLPRLKSLDIVPASNPGEELVGQGVGFSQGGPTPGGAPRYLHW